MAVQGKGTNPKTTLYVGGLEESVNESTLHAAFIPFGDIKDVNIPIDHASGKHRCAFYSATVSAGRQQKSGVVRPWQPAAASCMCPSAHFAWSPDDDLESRTGGQLKGWERFIQALNHMH